MSLISKIIWISSFALSYLPSSALALQCESSPLPIKTRVKIQDVPGYFFKVDGTGRYITFTTAQGNRLIDLQDKKTQKDPKPIPGKIDAVFSPDGKYLFTPHHGMHAFDANKLETQPFKNNDFSSAKVGMSPQTEGVYQSLGQTENGTYTMLTDKNGASLSTVSASGGKLSFGPQKVFCKEQFGNGMMDLPMLSKDGKFLSAYNELTQSTQVFNVGSEGNCSLAMDLGFPTGKANFSFDGKQMAFHVDHFRTSGGGYFSNVDSKITKDVYVVNLEKSGTGLNTKLTPIGIAQASHTEAMGDGSYYPEFTKNGDLVYLTDKGNFFEFNVLELKKLHFVPFSSISEGINSRGTPLTLFCQEKDLPATIIHSLWLALCQTPQEANELDKDLFALNINPETCKKLIEDPRATELLRQNPVAKGITKEVLLAACPKPTAKPNEETLGSWPVQEPERARALFQKNCNSCHSVPIAYKTITANLWYYDETGTRVKSKEVQKTVTLPPLDFMNLSAQDIGAVRQALNGSGNFQMPKNGSLSSSDRDEMLIALNRQLLNPSLATQSKVNKPESVVLDFYSVMRVQELIKEADPNETLFGLRTDQEMREAHIFCRYRGEKCIQLESMFLKKLGPTPKAGTGAFDQYDRRLKSFYCSLPKDQPAFAKCTQK